MKVKWSKLGCEDSSKKMQQGEVRMEKFTHDAWGAKCVVWRARCIVRRANWYLGSAIVSTWKYPTLGSDPHRKSMRIMPCGIFLWSTILNLHNDPLSLIWIQWFVDVVTMATSPASTLLMTSQLMLCIQTEFFSSSFYSICCYLVIM